jgi:RNA polymerase sigma-70 factor (ECF subfamily)
MSSIALRYTNSKDEALQGLNFGFMKVLKSLHRYDSKFALATWIRNILVNHLIDEYRKNKRYQSHEHVTDFEETSGGIALNYAEYKWEEDQLRSYLRQLPKVTEQVFNLFAIDGYTHKEIAEMLNVSVGTTKWHVSEARKRLKHMMYETQLASKKKVEVMNKGYELNR